MTDWGEVYRDNAAALGGLAGDLSGDQLATTVPATPAWTVKQVYQHLAGGANDALTGRMDGAPAPEWTDRHTREREDRTIDELVAELHGNQDAVAAAQADSARPALVWDIAVHHADLHEALGLGRPPDRLWLPVAETVAARTPQGLADRVSAYELFRAVFSRRSRGQLEGWHTGIDAETLAAMCVFGPRDDDQPVPDPGRLG